MRFRRERPPEGGDVWLVAGLGNPGPEYERTRHNVGFRAADVLAARLDARFKRGKHSAQVAEARRGEARVVLAKPTTFMNLSGRSIGPLATYFKVPPGRIVVLHDEIDIPFGDLRVKIGGGHAGHNGLRSLIQSLGTNEFVRIRIGVGRPPGSKEAADHVLDAFSKREEIEAGVLIEEAADAVESIIDDGADRAMNRVNTRD